MLRIGHKGTRGALENTPLAFRKALLSGADGVEFDVRMTKDGILVVCHDPRIDGFTNGSGYVRDMTLAELRRFTINGTNEKIATVEEALDAITKMGKPSIIQVDLKVQGTGTMLLNQLYRRDLQDISVISSFHRNAIREIKEMDAEIKTGLIKILPTNGPIEYLAKETDQSRIKLKVNNVLYRAYLYGMLLANRVSGSAFSDLINDAKEVGADYAMFWWGAATKSFVRKAHENGLKVFVGEVNTEKRARRMEKIGVDVLVTDLCDLLR